MAEKKSTQQEAITVETTQNGMVIRVTFGPGTPSASGKSVVLASTRGNQTLSNGITYGLNVYKKP